MTNNTSNKDKYNLFDTYCEADSESYIYEKCTWCGKNMEDMEEIFLDTETDNYLCKDCAEKYGIKAVKCAEY